MFFNLNAYAQGEVSPLVKKRVMQFIEADRVFYGLASYYEKPKWFLLTKGSFHQVEANKEYIVNNSDSLIVFKKLNVLIIGNSKIRFIVEDGKIDISSVDGTLSPYFAKLSKGEFFNRYTNFPKYAHLGMVLELMCVAVESVLAFLHRNLTSNWVIVIFIFAFLLKLLLFPVSWFTAKSQTYVENIDIMISPKLLNIKKNLDGEEAHLAIMKVYKDAGITPFYSLRPMIGTFLIIPFLITVFNVLGEVSYFDQQQFLWILDLSLPDAAFTLPIEIPIIGDKLNLLPFIMLGFSLLGFVYVNPGNRSFKNIKQISIPLLLFIFFYSFPAVMVLYWIIINLFDILINKLVRN